MDKPLKIDSVLLEEAKIIARKRKTTLGAIVNEALRNGLLRGGETAPAEPNAPLKTFRGDGLQPGIDLFDSAGLLEIMERA